tara:strand:+ start:1873 stop:2823 length:951 start_codon:yes stop_codon:yes gene_type:complete
MNSFGSRKVLNLIFYSIILFGFAIFIQNNRSELSFEALSSRYIFLVITLKFVNFLIFNQLHMQIFKIYDLNISKNENFELTYKGYIGNFFGFGKSGTGYKAIFLNKKYNFSYFKFTSFYVFLQTLTLFGTSLICLFILIFSETFLNENKNGLLLLLVLIILACIFSNLIFKFLSRFEVLKKIPYFNKYFLNLNEIDINTSISFIKNKKIYKILYLQLLVQINLFFQIFFQAKTLSIDISILSNFVYNLISQISIFLSLTPNSIGIKEFFLVISNQFIGLSPNQVFDLAIIDRITDFLSLILFTLLFNSIKNFIKRS